MEVFYLICLFGVGFLFVYLRNLTPKSEESLFTECNPETCVSFKTIHYTKKNGKMLGKVPQACYFYDSCPATRKIIK